MAHTDKLEKRMAVRIWRQVVLDAAQAWINEFPNVGGPVAEPWAEKWLDTYFEENMPRETINDLNYRDARAEFRADVYAKL